MDAETKVLSNTKQVPLKCVSCDEGFFKRLNNCNGV